MMWFGGKKRKRSSKKNEDGSPDESDFVDSVPEPTTKKDKKSRSNKNSSDQASSHVNSNSQSSPNSSDPLDDYVNVASRTNSQSLHDSSPASSKKNRSVRDQSNDDGDWTESTHREKSEKSRKASASNKKRNAQAVLPAEPVYCICRLPNTGEPMIECDKCNEWYHFRCVGMSAEHAARLSHYVCVQCEAAAQGKRAEDIATKKRKRAEEESTKTVAVPPVNSSVNTVAVAAAEKPRSSRRKNVSVTPLEEIVVEEGDGTGKWIEQLTGVESDSEEDEYVYMTSDDDTPDGSQSLNVPIPGHSLTARLIENLPSEKRDMYAPMFTRPDHTVHRLVVDIEDRAEERHYRVPTFHQSFLLYPLMFPRPLSFSEVFDECGVILNQIRNRSQLKDCSGYRLMERPMILNTFDHYYSSYQSIGLMYERAERLRHRWLLAQEWSLHQSIYPPIDLPIKTENHNDLSSDLLSIKTENHNDLFDDKLSTGTPDSRSESESAAENQTAVPSTNQTNHHINNRTIAELENQYCTGLGTLLSDALPLGLGHQTFHSDAQVLIDQVIEHAKENNQPIDLTTFSQPNNYQNPLFTPMSPHKPSTHSSKPFASPAFSSRRLSIAVDHHPSDQTVLERINLDNLYCIGCNGYVPVHEYADHLAACSIQAALDEDVHVINLAPYTTSPPRPVLPFLSSQTIHPATESEEILKLARMSEQHAWRSPAGEVIHFPSFSPTEGFVSRDYDKMLYARRGLAIRMLREHEEKLNNGQEIGQDLVDELKLVPDVTKSMNNDEKFKAFTGNNSIITHETAFPANFMMDETNIARPLLSDEMKKQLQRIAPSIPDDPANEQDPGEILAQPFMLSSRPNYDVRVPIMSPDAHPSPNSADIVCITLKPTAKATPVKIVAPVCDHEIMRTEVKRVGTTSWITGDLGMTGDTRSDPQLARLVSRSCRLLTPEFLPTLRCGFPLDEPSFNRSINRPTRPGTDSLTPAYFMHCCRLRSECHEHTNWDEKLRTELELSVNQLHTRIEVLANSLVGFVTWLDSWEYKKGISSEDGPVDSRGEPMDRGAKEKIKLGQRTVWRRQKHPFPLPDTKDKHAQFVDDEERELMKPQDDIPSVVMEEEEELSPAKDDSPRSPLPERQKADSESKPRKEKSEKRKKNKKEEKEKDKNVDKEDRERDRERDRDRDRERERERERDRDRDRDRRDRGKEKSRDSKKDRKHEKDKHDKHDKEDKHDKHDKHESTRKKEKKREEKEKRRKRKEKERSRSTKSSSKRDRHDQSSDSDASRNGYDSQRDDFRSSSVPNN